jgi:hypothetical protein
MSEYFAKLGTEVRYMSEDIFEDKPEMTGVDLINFYNQKFGEMLITDAIVYLESVGAGPEIIALLKTHYELVDAKVGS